jgi:hypothetical protein
MKLPRAILFDPSRVWAGAVIVATHESGFADQLGPIEVTVIAAAIEAASTELWPDPARHKYWRHRTGAVRRRIVATAFAALAAAGRPVPPEVIGDALADAYNACTMRNCRCSPMRTCARDPRSVKDNAMRRRKLQLRQYSGRRGDAHDWFPRPMDSKAVILRSACS